jgi:hypothetical protein
LVKKVTLAVIGLALAIGAVAAQQPTVSTGSSAPLAAVLARYERMSAVGHRALGAATSITTLGAMPAAPMPNPSVTRPNASGAPTSGMPAPSDSLDAMRVELRVLAARLDSHVGQGCGR